MTNSQAFPARISTLDGWRGVAILLVLAEHAGQYGQFKNQMWARQGSLGVDIFFVLSGYIITTRLISERAKDSTINLRSFYLRRVFRILPLVVIYLLALWLVSRFVSLRDFHWRELAGSLFFFRNYQLAAHPSGTYTAQFWSLSIEEHFYLLWPALFLWFGNRRALWLAVTGAMTGGVWRLYDCTHPSSLIGRMLPAATPGLRFLRTDVRFDGLLLGCALALALTRPSVRDFVFRNFPKETPLLAGVVLFQNLRWTNSFPSFTTYVLVTVMIASTLVVEEGLAHQWLNSHLLIWIGTISYSVYVWQQLFLLRPGGIICPLGRLSFFPVNMACVFGVAFCSFYFVERPAIAFGKRHYARKRNVTSPAAELRALMLD
jgi:peptidoglycan/LPS O-acetylase OafA/YrhL